MFYSVVTIRLDEKTYEFENTETNNFMLLGDVDKEFHRIGIDNTRDLHSMKKGDRKTFEHHRDGKMWFIYIARIN